MTDANRPEAPDAVMAMLGESQAPAAFTLVELLVVVTIITVLMTMLTPALEQAVEEARKAVCAANLRVIHAGVIDYGQMSNGYITPPWNSGSATSPVRIQIAMDTVSVERLSLVGLMNRDKRELTGYNPDGTTFTIVDREQTQAWNCPSRTTRGYGSSLSRTTSI